MKGGFVLGIRWTHIRRLRTARHLTQEDLAEKLSVTRQAVSAWETGKALPGIGITIILAIFYIILCSCGFIGTWRYQFWNQNYAVTLEELPGTYSLELDLTGLETNVGKILCEDDSGCRVTVKSMEETTALGGYKLVFLAEKWHGCVCHRRGHRSDPAHHPASPRSLQLFLIISGFFRNSVIFFRKTVDILKSH